MGHFQLAREAGHFAVGGFKLASEAGHFAVGGFKLASEACDFAVGGAQLAREAGHFAVGGFKLAREAGHVAFELGHPGLRGISFGAHVLERVLGCDQVVFAPIAGAAVHDGGKGDDRACRQQTASQFRLLHGSEALLILKRPRARHPGTENPILARRA